MKKVLWVGDAGVPSGFAVATHGILDTLRKHFEVTVLGINYRGDPHPYNSGPHPYDIWAAAAGGDQFGVGRILWMCDKVKPDVIVLQNDGWNIQEYVKQVRRAAEYAEVPIVAAVAVDGKNFQGSWLTAVHTTVFWTTFAFEESRIGGYSGPADIIPLGVDQTIYYPMDKHDARVQANLPKELDDAFLIGNINRNQPRKRWDLSIRYFANWIYGGLPVEKRVAKFNRKVNDAYLMLHAAPTGDLTMNVSTIAAYYGVTDRILSANPQPWYGYTTEQMRLVYNTLNVCMSTSQGEGMGLPAMEAMACGIPCLLPNWAAYADWAKDAAVLVPCTSTAVGPPWIGVLGGVADEEMFVEQLNALYTNQEYRERIATAGFDRVSQDRFRWENIGLRWKYVLDVAIAETEIKHVATQRHELDESQAEGHLTPTS
jgi:D-inositol-3-phosphate glycosyltransferase